MMSVFTALRSPSHRTLCANCGWWFSAGSDEKVCSLCVEIGMRKAAVKERVVVSVPPVEFAPLVKKVRKGAARERWYKSPEWLSVRGRVIARDGRVCAICGGYGDNVDHIIPRSKMPAFALAEENLRILCWPCNKAKNTRIEVDVAL